jgi:hypothetical protein
MNDKQVVARQHLEALMKRSGIPPKKMDLIARALIESSDKGGPVVLSDETRQMLIDALGEVVDQVVLTEDDLPF